MPAVSQKICTVGPLTTQKYTVICNNTCTLNKTVAVIVQLLTYCLLYLKKLHCPTTQYTDEHLKVHQYLFCDPALCRYYTSTNRRPDVSQQYCTVKPLTTQKNTLKCTSTWILTQPVAVNVQLPNNCMLYLNRIALSAHSLHRWTPLCVPVLEICSCPLPLLYFTQATARCTWTEIHCPLTHCTDEHL